MRPSVIRRATTGRAAAATASGAANDVPTTVLEPPPIAVVFVWPPGASTSSEDAEFDRHIGRSKAGVSVHATTPMGAVPVSSHVPPTAITLLMHAGNASPVANPSLPDDTNTSVFTARSVLTAVVIGGNSASHDAPWFVPLPMLRFTARTSGDSR